MDNILIYNTLTGRKEKFQPIHEGKVGFYLCGPTVYDFFHIGNARPFVIFDVIRRYLEYRNYEVTYLVNLTDVDDKLIKKAEKEKTTVSEIASRYIQAYFEDIRKLGIKDATVNPKATEHIPEMVEMVETLLQKGYAYRVNGDIFFDVSKFKDYGKLSGKKLDELQAGARVEVIKGKKNPLDFTLWKSEKKDEISWDTPIGKGRPGWHLECSAMAKKYLGEQVDIHAGGEDLIFPHHENEIAQSICSSGKPYVKYWMHIKFLKIREEKMAKSLGNFFTAREVVKEFGKEPVRLFFLQKHYRKPISYDTQLLTEAQTTVNRLGNSYKRIEEFLGREEIQVKKNDEVESIKSDFISAMDDDFNTAIAVSKFFDMFRFTNSIIDREERSEASLEAVAYARQIINDFNELFDIIPDMRKEYDIESSRLIELLLDIRNELRQKKEWELADKVRDKLRDLGIELEDGKKGTSWKKS